MRKMTGAELVAFARSKIGTPYVYGMKGAVMTQADYDYLKGRYGSMVWDSDVKKVGQVCVDCSGLISWACGVALGSAQWFERASVKQPIFSINDAPLGALVWQKGHIGIYSGMYKQSEGKDRSDCKNGVPMYITADGSAHGVREAAVSQSAFTHWLLAEDIFSYGTEGDEVVEKDKIIINGKEYKINMIRKDGVTFVRTRDLAQAEGIEVGSEGRTPVVSTR